MKFLILFMFFAVLIMSLAEDLFGYNPCYEPAETGECKSYIPRIYFDRYTKTCKGFVYGGCGGNANNFLTIEECEAACKKRDVQEPFKGTRKPRMYGGEECFEPEEVGPCKGHFIKYRYDPPTNTCVTFTYGGCNGNGNNFNSLQDCKDDV